MDRRYQVFISSTFTDLIEERKEVIQALLELDCLPAGMEMFPAANEDQWTLIRKVIDQSDFYAVVVGGRYGSMSAAGISYTEMEYDYAVEQGKTILGFAHANPGSIPADKTELDAAARERLDTFRDKVQTRHVKYYNNAEDLGGKVSRALSLAMRGTTAEGWVRGEFAMTAEKQAEVAELRATIAELRQQTASAKSAESKMPEDLAFGEQEYRLHGEARFSIKKDIYEGELSVPVSWDEIFWALGPALLHEASETELRQKFQAFAKRAVAEADEEHLPENFTKLQIFTVDSECFNDVIVQLFALKLTMRGQQKRTVSDRSKYWTLTELGHDELMTSRAIPADMEVRSAT